MSKVSVIIVNYNVKHYISQCVDSVLLAAEGLDVEIIIVDNHSADGSVPYLRKQYPNVRIMASSHNLGFSRANNIGIKRSNGDFILLLNPDTIIEKDTLRDCLNFMSEHDECGALGVCQRNPDGTRAMESRRGLPTPMTSFYKMSGLTAKFPHSRRFAKYYMSYLPWDEINEIEVISGAFFFGRREAIIKAGMLDEDYFMYGEDIDLSYCVTLEGYKNYFLPINILHYKGESTTKSSFRYVHVFYQAMLIFLSKHFSNMSFFLKLPIQFAIYLKATLALRSTLAYKAKKMLGFGANKRKDTQRYIFVVDKANLDACNTLASDNALDAEFITLSPQHSEELLQQLNHHKFVDKKNFTFIVYDLSVFSFTQILEKFAANPQENVMLGTYNPERNLIITHEECFTSIE